MCCYMCCIALPSFVLCCLFALIVYVVDSWCSMFANCLSLIVGVFTMVALVVISCCYGCSMFVRAVICVV